MRPSCGDADLGRVLRAIAEDQVPGRFGIHLVALDAFAAAALSPIQETARNGASANRRAAFLGGRASACEALKQIGYRASMIGSGAAGEPLWPDGCVGSICHTDTVAAAIVAPSPPMRGIGVDLEGNGPLDDVTMVDLVCRPEELVAACDPLDDVNLHRGKLIFVIKEAVFKLYWPVTHTFLEFHDVSVAVDMHTGRFSAELVDRRLPGLAGQRSMTGRFAEAGDFYVALAGSRF